MSEGRDEETRRGNDQGISWLQKKERDTVYTFDGNKRFYNNDAGQTNNRIYYGSTIDDNDSETANDDKKTAFSGSSKRDLQSNLHGNRTEIKKVYRGWCLSFFLCLSIFSILSAIGIIIAQIGTLSYDGRSLTSMPQTVAIRAYGVLFASIIIFTELRWTKMINESTFLQNWVTRGLFYVFVGLLTLEQNQEKAVQPNWIVLYVEVIGLILNTIGILYTFMGIMCLKRIKDQKEAEYKAKQYHIYTQTQLYQENQRLTSNY